MMQCKQCGGSVPEGSRFCPNCGTAVEPGNTGQSPEAIGEGAGYVAAPATRDDRNMAMLVHLSAFAGFLFPFGNIIAPLIIWLMKREESPFIDAHGKSALNFQISLSIYMAISAILIFVLVGIPLLIALGLFGIILVIIAAIRASDREHYNYPLAIPFIR